MLSRSIFVPATQVVRVADEDPGKPASIDDAFLVALVTGVVVVVSVVYGSRGLRVHDALTGAPMAKCAWDMLIHEGWRSVVATVVMAGKDVLCMVERFHKISVRLLATLEVMFTLKTSIDAQRISAAHTAECAFLVCASWNGSFCVWNLETPKEVLATHTRAVSGHRYSHWHCRGLDTMVLDGTLFVLIVVNDVYTLGGHTDLMVFYGESARPVLVPCHHCPSDGSARCPSHASSSDEAPSVPYPSARSDMRHVEFAFFLPTHGGNVPRLLLSDALEYDARSGYRHKVINGADASLDEAIDADYRRLDPSSIALLLTESGPRDVLISKNIAVTLCDLSTSCTVEIDVEADSFVLRRDGSILGLQGAFRTARSPLYVVYFPPLPATTAAALAHCWRALSEDAAGKATLGKIPDDVLRIICTLVLRDEGNLMPGVNMGAIRRNALPPATGVKRDCAAAGCADGVRDPKHSR